MCRPLGDRNFEDKATVSADVDIFPQPDILVLALNAAETELAEVGQDCAVNVRA